MSIVMPTPMKNSAEQQAAERLDVGLELVAVVRFREQHAGEKRAERHRHADDVHQQRGAEHDQQRGGGHHLARAGPGEQAEERIEQVAPGEHQRRDGAADQRRDCAVSARLTARRAGAEAKQRDQREQRHDRHVLEQQDRKGALAVGLLQMAALLEDAQRDRGGGQRQREAGDQRGAPLEQCRSSNARPEMAAAVMHELRHAEAEDVAPHREQARQFELEPDQEQQHHDAELGDR